MQYRMKINSTKPVQITIRTKDGRQANIILAVGQRYVVGQANNDRHAKRNAGRPVEILGFTSNWTPEGAIVRYLDTNRRGRVPINNLIPENDKLIEYPKNNTNIIFDIIKSNSDAKKRYYCTCNSNGENGPKLTDILFRSKKFALKLKENTDAIHVYKRYKDIDASEKGILITLTEIGKPVNGLPVILIDDNNTIKLIKQ